VSDLPTAPVPPPPAPSTKKPRRWPWILGMVVTLFIGIGIGAAGAPSETETSADSPVPVAESPTTEAPTSPSPTPEPVAEPEGTFGLAQCDVNLFSGGTFPNQTSTFVGAIEVRNTGEVPATIRVTFTWLLLGASNVDAKPKTVTLQPGASRFVTFSKSGISGEQVDAFQAHPAYGDSENCRSRARFS
jgi:hypothetical protein